MGAKKVILIKDYTYPDSGKIRKKGQDMLVDNIKEAELIRKGYVAPPFDAVKPTEEKRHNYKSKLKNRT